LASLESRGLVRRAPRRPGHYAAADPEIGLELLLLQREEGLKKARLATSHLTERFHQARAGRDPTELIEVITGARLVSQRLNQLERGAREQMRMMARPAHTPQRPTAQSNEDNRAITAELHARRVHVRNLIDRQAFDYLQWFSTPETMSSPANRSAS